ncbi:MAG: UDP-N-acetylmuramoyl-L-alanyl-D-glutamate--2,6-diaminopimelate ligase [Bacteroidetes bacterium]|jgi:UDP-N-acetylmuramoyl-L-alanyl-D-glutamate--2,6-diaminopimelate ligase|nr:UDP-N-acetylmuramoyl-L-alanyl-D-glutamate--2,6-diaminopimelate ligase [Bacteroidota bacterium]
MKLLKDILYKAGLTEVEGSTNVAITAISFDSRKVEKDSLFVAVKGTLSDGHKYIDDTISKGAIAILCEDFPVKLNEKVTYIKVNDTTLALGIVASNFYDNPSEKIKLVGVTGTNGKTTTVTLLFNLFKKLGYKVGLLSTVKNQINNDVIPATHTTPDAIQLNAMLRQMIEKGCTHCFMEVSSHAVVQNRIAGITFTGGVFTNITHDHLDYHKTFDEYIKAKKKFFDGLSANAFALTNRDDSNGEIMLQNTRASKRTYSLRSMADFKCRVVENQFSGLLLNIDNQEVWSKLIGSFNAFNLLAVYATAILLKEDKTNVLTTLSTLSSVEGRFQYIRTDNGVIGIVDYAHTPDALMNVLKTINDIRTGNEKVITVVGCGGDRDSVKRPVMAKIACDFSTKVILTSDNPRSEEPEAIIKDMQAGVDGVNRKKTISMTDRAEAIKTACSYAEPGDIILIAGKGHEKYQEIKGVKHEFDDMLVLQENLRLFDK